MSIINATEPENTNLLWMPVRTLCFIIMSSFQVIMTSYTLLYGNNNATITRSKLCPPYISFCYPLENYNIPVL